MGAEPRAPGWVVWMMRRMMPEQDVRVALAELRELHTHWKAEIGEKEADRRFRRQVRQYPFRLVWQALTVTGRTGPWASRTGVTQSVRSLMRAPGLTSAIVLTVGVGIGGCTAIFAVVDALFLQPLPYPDAERLTLIQTESMPHRWPFSVVDYQALSEQQTSFEAVAAYDRSTSTLTTAERAERITVIAPTPGFFEMFGISPVVGRTPVPDEGLPDAEPTVLVTQDFADRHFDSSGSDAVGALGRTVELDGLAYQVIGVLPSYVGPLGRDVEAFTTLRLQPPQRRGPFFLNVFGKLRTDVDHTLAAEELRAINDRLFPLWADSYQNEGSSWGFQDLRDVLRGDAGTGRLLLILMGAVGMLLLVATANAANLLIARVAARRRELAVRRALGATRAHVMGHLMLESALLTMGGVAVGLLLARGGVALLPVVASSYLPRLTEVGLGGSVWVFAVFLAAGCGLLFGLIPAVQGGGGPDLTEGLRSGGRTATGGRGEQRTQRLLVAGQLAIVVPLLAGAGLLLSSFVRLQSLDPGFDAQSLLSMRVSLSPAAYPDTPTRSQFWDQALERIGALPGVEAAAVAGARPPENLSFTNNFNLEDNPTPPGQSEPSSPWVISEPAFFEVMGIPLLKGRGFEPADIEDGPPTVLVDEAWERRYFPGESAVGRRFVEGGDMSSPMTTVVGVVGEVPYQGLGGEGGGAVYRAGARGLGSPYLMIRVAGDPAAVTSLVREELRRMDSTAPITALATGETLLGNSLTRPRHLSLLLTVFALVALLLAVVGLYGITAYSVQRRAGDIAIRLALGGSPSSVLSMVVRQGMGLAAVGVAVGVAVALGVNRILVDLLYEVSPDDPWTLLGVAALMLSVSAVACLIPGRHAVRLDPSSTLREE